jgi:hypothetical protein
MKNIKRLLEGTLTYRNIEFNKKYSTDTRYEEQRYMMW